MRTNLNFFREMYHIPPEIKLSWCLIEETPEESYRLGVMLLGHNRVIDVAGRRFVQRRMEGFSTGKPAFIAKRYSEGDEFVYVDEFGHQINKPKSYVRDIYFRCVYSQEMMRCNLI